MSGICRECSKIGTLFFHGMWFCEICVEKMNHSPAFHDPVNSPSHYTGGGIETIDFIEAKELGFCLGNAVKYIARAGKKDPGKKVEDLRKAIWYLEREINKNDG